MEPIQRFIDVNMVVVYFAYGLVFFAAGLAIVLQQLRLSSFRLARYLWLLATFFIIHGISDWGNVFVPIQSAYLSEAWVDVLFGVQKVALGASFAFLLLFAVIMVSPRLRLSSGMQKTLMWQAIAYSALITLIGTFIFSGPGGDTLIRYFLAFPSSILALMAFLSERRSFRVLPTSAVPTDLTVTAGAFAIYAVLSGLIVPEQQVWPFSLLTYSSVFDTTEFPVQLYRTLVGLTMAVFIIRTLSVFDLEIRDRLEAADRTRTLFKDRQRIARDLHDGTIQAIYAAGLQLEAAAGSTGTRPDEAIAIIRGVIKQLNSVITDTREYIFKLGSSRVEESDIYHHIKRIVDEFAASCPTAVNLSFDGDNVSLSPSQVHNVTLIVNECLGNVAKHSEASSADIKFVFGPNAMFCSVEDNGIGIDDQPIHDPTEVKSGRGLKNIAERAKALEAKLSISRGASGAGTRVALWVPYQQETE